jgi:hypothetical protein
MEFTGAVCAPGYAVLHNFTGYDGLQPISLLLSGTTLYGTTVNGGDSRVAG